VHNALAEAGLSVVTPFGATLYVMIFLSVTPTLAARLGAYYVDDAEIGKSGPARAPSSRACASTC
jgi:hypothetical protein